jgi:glutamyl-tRNA reductase
MDQFAIIGATYKTASVEELARIGLSREDLTARLPGLAATLDVAELACVSTCNRVEFLMIAKEGVPVSAYRQRVAAVLADDRTVEPLLRAWHGEGAIEHLLMVTAGLDSAQAGEREIRDQVNIAWSLARNAGTAGPDLGFLFAEALRVAAEVHTQNVAGASNASLADIAVGRILDHLRSFPGAVALIGVSPMTRRCATQLAGAGIRPIIVNRTIENAQALAAKVNGTARPLDSFLEAPDAVSAIVAAVGGKNTLLSRPWFERHARQDAPLLVLDFGMPPHVAPEAATVSGVVLAQMDEFVRQARHKRSGRLHDLAPARLLVDHHLARLAELFAVREAGAALDALAKQYVRVASESAEGLLRGELKHLDAATRTAILTWAETLGRRLAHLPLQGLRAVAADSGAGAATAFVHGLSQAAERSAARGHRRSPVSQSESERQKP